MRRVILVLLAAWGVGVSGTPLNAQEAPSLERALVRAAPAVIKHCQDRGYQNVGVLKFLAVKEGKTRLTDNAGTINRTVARQLELGMILANDPRSPLGIIEDASAVAANTPGANHLTPEGRLKLFEPKYPLAWGSEKVKADAFVTGVVGVSQDLKTLEIQMMVFDKKTNKLEPVGPKVVAANDPRKLSEMGESFTRGAFDNGQVETVTPKQVQKKEAEVLDKAKEVREEVAKHPAQDPNAPVKLEILYDGRPVPIEVRNGQAFVAEPEEGQNVVLQLKRNPAAAGTLGCVLKVNGENTLFRQRLPDLRCRKWLLYPNNTAGVRIIGFQKDEKTTERFRVLSKSESKAREINYGSDVGTITLTVFREQQGKGPGTDLSEETQSTKVLEQVKLPEKKPESFDALTQQLLADANNRGLIAEGSAAGNEIRIVKFEPDPTPVMCITIVYYKK